MITAISTQGFQAAEDIRRFGHSCKWRLYVGTDYTIHARYPVIYIIPEKTPDIIKQKEDVFNVLFIDYLTTAMRIFFKLLNAIKMGGCY